MRSELVHPFGLSDPELAVIKEKLAEKKALAQGRCEELFGVFNETLNPEEQLALEFLFAFMPLVDLADYSGDLFLRHVRHSLRALKEAPWGQRIPGQLFLHFVLPYRISNETIEDYRPYFWNELYDRVKDLSMADAILEVNHWCHAKATYKASDPRTSSPLTLIRAARGRCGEESALLVVALRSLSIPARQVYAPRWSHTDSNHAWVEAWADGKWHFLGACEPEPRLNKGWFTGAASRAMLVHTRVPGTIYAGPEAVVQCKDDHTELNLLANYALVRSLKVRVKDLAGRPVEGAVVELQVFNYGGFSTLVSLQTDCNGEAALTTGHGDLWIHAVKDGVWGSVLARGEGPGTVEVVLGTEGEELQQFTMHAPAECPLSIVQVSAEESAENDRRLREEDAIRAAYESTFVSREKAGLLAIRLGVDPEKSCAVLERARGNSHALYEYLAQAVPEFGPMALELAHVLPAKDLIDTNADTLLDHLEGALPYEKFYPQEQFIKYVLQPRVSCESLRGYRTFFQREFSLEEQEAFRNNPLKLKAWIDAHIKTAEDGAVRGWPSPKGTYELGAGNQLAKQILFVAMARSFGAAARLSPIDGKVRSLSQGSWVQIDSAKSPADPGVLRIREQVGYRRKISYFHNFALARLEKGVFRTLRFRGLDEEAFDDEAFPSELELEAGRYRLTAGKRLESGDVCVTLRDFTLLPGEILDLTSVFSGKEVNSGRPLGELPATVALLELDGGEVVLDYLKGERPIAAIWIDPEREPTKHLLRELRERREQFEDLGITVLLCLGDDRAADFADPDMYGALPCGTRLIRDADYRFFSQVQGGLQAELPMNFPMVAAADGKGTVRYASAGYQIGTAGYILDSLQKG